MVKSNFDDNNLFTVNISPISSKQEYSCLCEVVEEYGGNLDYLMGKISQAIKKNTLLYQDYSNADHLDIGSHCHAFPSFDLGDGYIAYVGMFWPEMKENLAISLTKEFVLENGGDDMTMVLLIQITPMNHNLHSLPGCFLNIFRILRNLERISSSLMQP